MTKCQKCKKTIDPKNDFFFHCENCEAVFCGDCGIDADTECPKCGAVMKDENEGGQ